MAGELALVTEAMAAYSRGDVDALLATVHEQVEWNPPLASFAGPYRGRAQVAEWYAEVRGMFESVAVAPKEFRQTPDGRILGLWGWTGRVCGGHADMEQDMLGVVTFRDGLIWRYEAVTNPTRAQFLATGWDAAPVVSAPEQVR